MAKIHGQCRGRSRDNDHGLALAGMFTHYQYAAEIGEHVVLLDEHVSIESLACEAVGRSTPPTSSDAKSADPRLPLLRGSALFTQPTEQV